MLKRSMIAACVLALSAGTAFAGDNWMTNWVPPGPNDTAGGANGAARTRDVGSTGTVGETGDSRSTSSSILEQRLKQQSAAGVATPTYNSPNDTVQAWGTDQPAATYRGGHGRGGAYIVDEYGFRYDSRGNRIN